MEVSVLVSCWNVCVSVRKEIVFGFGMVQVLGVEREFCKESGVKGDWDVTGH